jgi:mono/diheme cytochrome c family protein
LKKRILRTKSVPKNMPRLIAMPTGDHMLRRSILAGLFVLFGHFADAGAQAMPDATRGDLLYSTHCIACHSVQVHWREKSVVTDWTSLRLQVRRWQGNAELGWSDGDIAEVARYLNDLHYRYPRQD